MKGKNRCTVLMCPKDANNLSITNHQKIRITSNVGSIELPVEISDEMKEGVLSIPHGFGHNRQGTKIKLAEENAGESINDLTDDYNIDKLTGNAVELLQTLNKLKPTTAKGIYMKSVFMSSTMSPSLGKGIGLGYVPRTAMKSGTEIYIQIRKKAIPATIVKLPFYKG